MYRLCCSSSCVCTIVFSRCQTISRVAGSATKQAVSVAATWTKLLHAPSFDLKHFFFFGKKSAGAAFLRRFHSVRAVVVYVVYSHLVCHHQGTHSEGVLSMRFVSIECSDLSQHLSVFSVFHLLYECHFAASSAHSKLHVHTD